MNVPGACARAVRCALPHPARGQIAIFRTWCDVPVVAKEVFFLFRVVLGHFFGLFPSVPTAIPKMPGVVIIKAPVTAHNK